MFVEYTIDREDRVVRVTFAGILTFDDIQQYCQKLRRDPQFDESFDEIVNLGRVQDIDLDSSQMVQLADKLDPYSGESRRAFVIKSAEQRNAAIIHGLLRNSSNIRAFPSMLEAERWTLSVSRMDDMDKP